MTAPKRRAHAIAVDFTTASTFQAPTRKTRPTKRSGNGSNLFYLHLSASDVDYRLRLSCLEVQGENQPASSAQHTRVAFVHVESVPLLLKKMAHRLYACPEKIDHRFDILDANNATTSVPVFLRIWLLRRLEDQRPVEGYASFAISHLLSRQYETSQSPHSFSLSASCIMVLILAAM